MNSLHARSFFRVSIAPGFAKLLVGPASMLLILSIVWTTHWASGNMTPFDSKWSIYLTMSILREGKTDLDAYRAVIPEDDYRIERVDGHLYPKYPIGSSVLAIPIVFVFDLLFDSIGHIDLYDHMKHAPPDPAIWAIEALTASLLVALTAVLIYVLARRFLDPKYSLLIVAIFAYGTSAWSTASRGLWAHGPSMLMLTISLYVILRSKDAPQRIQFSSIPLALAYVMRPTNSLSVFLLTVFVFIQYRNYFWRYLLWALPIAGPFLLYNFSIYHSLLPSYYLLDAMGSTRDFWVGLAGTLISPSRGLFIYSPFLLFAIYGVVLELKRAEFERVDHFLLGILFLHWILISANWSWWGGHSFGPRLFADMIPYLMYFLIPAVAAVQRLAGTRKLILSSALFTSIVVSVLIHYHGATNVDVYEWNLQPGNIDDQPARLWDWSDPQFLRGIDLKRQMMPYGWPQRPSLSSRSDDGKFKHNGIASGYPHIVSEKVARDDVYPHPDAADVERREWLMVLH